MQEQPIHYNLRKNGTLTEAMSLILQACMRGKLNILISADADAGKAELVEGLCACIGFDVSKFNRIIGGCASLDHAKLLQVMSNCCPGSILTVCAESPAKGLLQLEGFVREADSSFSRRAAKELICSSIDLVIQTARMQDDTWFAITEPTWRIKEITELIWVSDDEEHWREEYERGEGYYRLCRIYFFDGATGAYVGSGLPPQFLERLEQAGIPFLLSWLRGGPVPPAHIGLLSKEQAQRRFDNPIQLPKEPQLAVAFAKRPIKAGEIISSADFEIRSVGVSLAPPPHELYLAVDGARAKVDVNAGVPIKRSDIDTSFSSENRST
jgi:SAF domain